MRGRIAPALVGVAVGVAVVVSMLTASRADAAALACSASVSVTPSVRAEGATEAIGDVVVSCTGGTPTLAAQAVPSVTVTLLTNAPITSRLLAPPWSEALLLLDEPGTPGNPTQAACAAANGVCANLGNGAGRATPAAPNYYVGQGAGQNVNVFQGTVSGSSVSFPSVPLDPPGDGLFRTFRITNVRVNAGALPPASSGQAVSVVAAVSMSGAGAPAVANAQQNVAFAQPGLGFTVLNAAGDAALTRPVSVPACPGPPVRIATLSFRELFATALRPRGLASSLATPSALGDQATPGFVLTGESMLVNSALVGNAARGALADAGRSDAGTRLEADFATVPAGVSLFADSQATTGGESLLRTAGAVGPFSPVAPSAGAPAGAAAIPVAAGGASAVWEAVAGNPNAAGTVRLGVYAGIGAGRRPAPSASRVGPLPAAPTRPPRRRRRCRASPRRARPARS